MQAILVSIFGVLSFIFLLHFINFKVIIKYDSVLLITFKILFFKYSFSPIKDEIDFHNIFSFEGVLSELDEIKSVIEFIFSTSKDVRQAYKEFISHLKYRLIYLDVLVSLPEADKGALTFSMVSSLVSLILGYLKSNSTLKITKESKISLLPGFTGEKSHLKFKVISEISLIALFTFWLKMGIKILLKSILKPRKRLENFYGTKQAK